MVADFGCSTFQKISNQIVGTPGYMALEVCKKEYYTNKVDSWSTGVLMFELLSKHLPFGNEEPEETQTFCFPNHLSKDVQDLIGDLLVFNANNRMTISTVRNHKWFSDMKIWTIEV